MENKNVRPSDIANNLKVLNNITEVVTSVVREISGNDIASTINGEVLNREAITMLSNSHIREFIRTNGAK